MAEKVQNPLGVASEARVGFRASQLALTSVFAGLSALLLYNVTNAGVNKGLELAGIDRSGAVADGMGDFFEWMAGVVASIPGGMAGAGIAVAIVWVLSYWRFGSRRGPKVARRFLG